MNNMSKETIKGSLVMEWPSVTKFGGVRLNQLTLLLIWHDSNFCIVYSLRNRFKNKKVVALKLATVIERGLRGVRLN